MEYFPAKYAAPLEEKEDQQVSEMFQTFEMGEGQSSIVFAIASDVTYRSPIFRKVESGLKASESFFFDQGQVGLTRWLRQRFGPCDHVAVVGLETLSHETIVSELRQLNLSREAIVSRGTTLLFWLCSNESLEYFRKYAGDLWDIRSMIVDFDLQEGVDAA
ncbi:MAG: hypothetical protein F6J98_03065 [Moorea sp. SIO4G2]|uniref:hypothetical protein n=1 Tax=unclassified Moorena TaxID=2683338 RepID=UPI0013FB8A15|nr:MULTISPECIES: hypothetical protein [unclassified Moorena]NEO17047.1 hypothetical protein [Moorena sp. SIO3E8]NEO59433.1 hypothetical protein [Moorena sp. SIO4G2]NEQ03623.1 hypothetical protein [Moorena sp. SIO3F7]